jgi:hypothetical protein
MTLKQHRTTAMPTSKLLTPRLVNVTRSISRRGLLKTALGSLVLGPFVRTRALHAQNSLPKRLIMVFTPDSNPPEWWPTGTGAEFTLNEPLADFAGLESQLLLPRRLDHSWTYDNHHVAGIVQLFTGGRFDDDVNKYADGPSVDQYLLQNTELRGGTPRASIHLGVDDGRTDQRHVICYSGASQPMGAEVSPSRAFNNFFEGVTFGETQQPTEPAPTGPSLGSQLDAKIVAANQEDLRYLQRFLGNDEKARLELHLDALSELEKQLAAAGAGPSSPAVVGGTCSETDVTGFRNSLNDATSMTRWAEINADLIVNAFTCDVTRVASYQFSFSGGHHEGLMGFRQSWHDEVAHVSNTDDSVTVGSEAMSSRAAFNRFSRFWYGHVAALAKKLEAIPEGDGTMLDNTLIYCGVESGTNHSHNPNDMQYLLVGGRNLGFATGQVLDVGRQSAHRLHVAVLNAFGAEVDTFGSADNGTGALAGVLA